MNRGQWMRVSAMAVAMVCTGCSQQQPVLSSTNRNASDALAKRIADAYGGNGAWSRVRYLRFDMVEFRDGRERGRYRHLWDRQTGLYRYEADAERFAELSFYDDATAMWQPIGLQLPPGRLVALVNRSSGEGHVFIDGHLADPSLVRRVRERIEHDCFWLLMPFDLGGQVRLVPDGRATRVRVVFPLEGRKTSNDSWWLELDPQTMRIRSSVLQPQHTDEKQIAQWKGFETIDGVSFCLQRSFLDERALAMQSLALPREMPEVVFEDPMAPLR